MPVSASRTMMARASAGRRQVPGRVTGQIAPEERPHPPAAELQSERPDRLQVWRAQQVSVLEGGHQTVLPRQDLLGLVLLDLALLTQTPEARQTLGPQVDSQCEVLSRASHHAAVARLPALRVLDAKEMPLGGPAPRGEVPEGNRGCIDIPPLLD